jgi:hypothetical protein
MYIYIGIHMKGLLFLSDSNQSQNVLKKFP